MTTLCNSLVQESSSTFDTHLKETLGLFLGLPQTQVCLIPPMPAYLRRLLFREEEYQSPLKDQWDNWEHPYAENYQRKMLWEPEVDLWVQDVRSDFLSKGFELMPSWPQEAPFAVCLTHDVDHISPELTLGQRWREVIRTPSFPRLLKPLAKCFLKPSSSIPDTRHTLELCYAMEKSYGVTSSYFFTVFPLSRYSQYDCLYSFDDRCRFLGQSRRIGEMMQILINEGFDVGLHGSYYSATEPGLLSEQKKCIEKALNSKVYTTRQHWLHWKFPITPEIQAQAGFLADTTLGYNRNIGFRAGTSYPFNLFDLKHDKPFNLEVPLILQDGAIIGTNALEHPPEYALPLIKSILTKIENVGGCATILFHPDIFLKPGMDELYRHLIEYCLKKKAWFANLKQISEWWTHRRKILGYPA